MNICSGARRLGKVLACLLTVSAVLAAAAGIRPVVIMSGSMEPEIPTGSLCFVDTGDKVVEKGDIVMYRSADISVVHRLEDIASDGSFITKGDNNDTVDPRPVEKSCILGTAVFWVPVLGYAVCIFKRAAVFAAVLAPLLLIFAISSAIRRSGALKSSRKLSVRIAKK